MEHISVAMRKVIEKITDKYCAYLLSVQREHDFDDEDIALREDRPLCVVRNCLQRAKEIEARKKSRGA